VSTLQWILKLATGAFTGPANNAAKAVDNLNQKLRASQRATTSTENAHKHAAFNWNKGVSEMNKRQGEFNKTAATGNNGMLEAAGGIAAVEAAAIGASVAVAALGVALLAKGSSMAIEASAFRESSIAAFKVILGTQKEAEGIFNKADELAGRLGLQDEQVIAQLKKLTSVGFGADTALGIVKAAADVAAIQGEAAGSTFAQLIATMEAKGKFDTRALKQLATIGVKTEDIFAAVAKKMKISSKEAEALIKAGKVDTKVAVEAILETVQGRFGGAADAIADTVPRLLFRLQDAIGDLFNEVDTTALKEALDSVLTSLAGPEGAKVKEGLNKIFGGLFDALFGAFDQNRVDGIMSAIGDVLNQVGDIILAMAPGIAAFIGGMVDGFIDVWKILKPIGEAFVSVFQSLGGSKTFVEVLGMLGRGLAYVIALVILFAALIGGMLSIGFAVLGAIVGGIGAIIGYIGSFISSLFGAGENMMTGLADGITSGASGVVQAMVGAVTNAIGAAKSALGIASPSKVFEGFGSFTSQGFAEGIANDNSGADAMGAMIEPPSPLTAQQTGRSAGASAGAGGGGGGKGGGITIEQLIVQAASGEPQDTANAVTEALEQMLLATGS
jgi:hypothetical protein